MWRPSAQWLSCRLGQSEQDDERDERNAEGREQRGHLIVGGEEELAEDWRKEAIDLEVAPFEQAADPIFARAKIGDITARPARRLRTLSPPCA
jgi:hypothetical protein